MFFKPVKPQAPVSRKKTSNVYKTRSQLLKEFLEKHNGPLTLQNSKLLNARVRIHQRLKEEKNKKHKLILMNLPPKTVFKPKSPKKAKAGPSKPKSPKKAKAGPPKPKSPKKAKAGPSKPKCTTPRCKALKMKNQKVCDAKIKNGDQYCKRHRK